VIGVCVDSDDEPSACGPVTGTTKTGPVILREDFVNKELDLELIKGQDLKFLQFYLSLPIEDTGTGVGMPELVGTRCPMAACSWAGKARKASGSGQSSVVATKSCLRTTAALDVDDVSLISALGAHLPREEQLRKVHFHRVIVARERASFPSCP
jgi:hypothetical protein